MDVCSSLVEDYNKNGIPVEWYAGKYTDRGRIVLHKGKVFVYAEGESFLPGDLDFGEGIVFLVHNFAILKEGGIKELVDAAVEAGFPFAKEAA